MLLTPDYNPTGASKGNNILLMSAQTVLATKSTVVCPGSGNRNHTVTIQANASVAGVGITGALQLETSNNPTLAGGWAPLGGGPIDLSTIVIPAAQTVGIIELQFSGIMINALRGQITTVVAGGTVSLLYQGQG